MPSNHSSERERDTSLGTGDYSGRSTPDTRDRSGGSTSGGQSNHSSERERDTSLGGGNTGGSNSGRGGNTSAGEQSNHASERERDFSVSGGGFNAAADRSPDRPDNYAAGMNDLGRGTSAPTGGLGAGRSPDRPDNYMAGRNDLTRSGSTPTGFSPTGRTGGFGEALGQPSFRQAEIDSMRALSSYNYQTGPTQRQTEEQSMADYAFNRTIDRIIGVESAGRTNAKNSLSTATGLGQFISGTWMDMIERHRPDLLAGRTRQEVLGLRTDPTLSRQMTEALARENIDKLKAANIAVTPASVYAAHFLGSQGAIAAYRADPTTSAVDVLGKDVVNANPNIMSGRTIGHVVDYIDNRMAKADIGYSPAAGGQRTGASPTSVPVGPRGGDTALPADRPVMGPAGGANATPQERPSFADRYLNAQPAAPTTPEEDYFGPSNRTGWATRPGDDGVREIDRSVSGYPSRDVAQSTDAGSPSRPDNRDYAGPRGMGGQGGMYVGDVPARTGRQDGWSTPSVAPTQPSGAQPGSVGPGQSVAPVSPGRANAAPVQSNPQTVTGNEVPQQRSIGQRVAAGAIDIGAGMIPGIGPAIGIGNGIAAAIGARTLGERIVDGAGENTYQPGQVPDREGGRGDAPGWFREPEEAVDGPSDEVATPDDPVMTFTRRYLDPSRPTPGQKWGRPNQYGGVDLVG